MDAKRQAEIFEAMPHVDEIWVTEDGHFHLHPNNGGELICRGDAEVANEETETPKGAEDLIPEEPAQEEIQEQVSEQVNEVANEETETPKVLKPVVKRRPQIKK